MYRNVIKRGDEEGMDENQTTNTEPVEMSQPANMGGMGAGEAPQVTMAQPTPAPIIPSKPPKKWLLPALIVGTLLIGGGAAAYLTIFQKSPEKLLSNAMSNTSDGLKSYLDTMTTSTDEGFKMTGSIDVESPLVMEANMEGAWKGSNGSMKADVSAAGLNASLEMLTVADEAGDTPDVYAKVSGLDTVSALLGESNEISGLLDSIDSQWVMLDSTLIDQAASGLDVSDTSALSMKPEDLQKISQNMTAVLEERLFTTDSSKAVFNLSEKIGKEEFEGTSTYKMRVNMNKDNFKAFVVALKDAAKETKLEELLTSGESGKTIEEALDFDAMIKDIEAADYSNVKADVWVEAGGRYIRNVRIYEDFDSSKGSYVDIGMKYEGGDELPLYIRFTSDDESMKGTVTVGLKLNKESGDVGVNVAVDAGEGQSAIKGSMEMSLAGSNDDVTVEVPEDAINALELLGAIGGDGLTQADPSLLTDPSLLEDFGTDMTLDDTEL